MLSVLTRSEKEAAAKDQQATAAASVDDTNNANGETKPSPKGISSVTGNLDMGVIGLAKWSDNFLSISISRKNEANGWVGSFKLPFCGLHTFGWTTGRASGL